MDPKKLLGEAQLLFVEGKEKESIEKFHNALEAGADPFMVFLSIGAAHLKLKETDKAIENFTKAIDINPENPRTFYYRGLAFLGIDEYEKSASDLSKALELKPVLFPAIFARATAYAHMQKYEEAAKDLKTVLPHMEANLQGFSDTYGIIRTQLWKVMAQGSGEGSRRGLALTEEEIDILKNWLGDE
jgi:tetratricopeptide (TPR) repeat protein